MKKISLVIITKNEEPNIEKCIQSVPFANEIIVVDSGSTDKTEIIAKRNHAKFIFNPWPGFGKQKQFAIDQASNDWVLLLDADEYLERSLQQEIENLLRNETKYDAFAIARKQIFINRDCHFGKSVDYPVRLVNRSKGQFDLKNIHESFISNGNVGQLSGFMMHNSGVTVIERCRKIMRDLELELIDSHYSDIKIKNVVIDPIIYFLSYYIKKQGFRDGMPGFILTALFTIHIFLLNASKYELKITKR